MQVYFVIIIIKISNLLLHCIIFRLCWVLMKVSGLKNDPENSCVLYNALCHRHVIVNYWASGYVAGVPDSRLAAHRVDKWWKLILLLLNQSFQHLESITDVRLKFLFPKKAGYHNSRVWYWASGLPISSEAIMLASVDFHINSLNNSCWILQLSSWEVKYCHYTDKCSSVTLAQTLHGKVNTSCVQLWPHSMRHYPVLWPGYFGVNNPHIDLRLLLKGSANYGVPCTCVVTQMSFKTFLSNNLSITRRLPTMGLAIQPHRRQPPGEWRTGEKKKKEEDLTSVSQVSPICQTLL